MSKLFQVVYFLLVFFQVQQAQQVELSQSKRQAEAAEARNAALSVELQQAKACATSQREVHFNALPAAISPSHLMKESYATACF